jgi:hypothetical protein
MPIFKCAASRQCPESGGTPCFSCGGGSARPYHRQPRSRCVCPRWPRRNFPIPRGVGLPPYAQSFDGVVYRRNARNQHKTQN